MQQAASLRAQLEFEKTAQRRALNPAAPREVPAPAASISSSRSAAGGQDDWPRLAALNNAACGHQQAGKQHLAALSLDRALQLLQGAPVLRAQLQAWQGVPCVIVT